MVISNLCCPHRTICASFSLAGLSEVGYFLSEVADFLSIRVDLRLFFLYFTAEFCSFRFDLRVLFEKLVQGLHQSALICANFNDFAGGISAAMFVSVTFLFDLFRFP